MGESHVLAVDLENPRVERLSKRTVEASAERRLQNRDVRVGQRWDGAYDLESCGAETVDAGVEDLVETRGNREVFAGGERSASALQRGCQLEREEGVAARGLPEPDQRRPRKRRVEAGTEQLVGRAEAQPREMDRSSSILADDAAQAILHAAA